jgi:restriction system protein
MIAAWVVRAGKYGERAQWVLANGRAGTGWQEVPDLTACDSRAAVAVVVAAAFPDLTVVQQANYTGQLWALRGRIHVGDLMVLPVRATKEIAIGRVIGGYEYLSEEAPDRRHTVQVAWQIKDLPRSAVKQDLLYTLGSALTIFAPSKGHAVERLEALLKTGEDPGAVGFGPAPKPGKEALDEDDVDEPELHADVEEVARDQITTRIAEEFAGHDLAALVTALLEAEGFTCTMSPPGADQGIDIVAGRGLLGMDAPRVIVQVKSGSGVGESVVRDLLGVVSTQNADQGLLIAWGGLTGPARMAVHHQQFKIRAWTSEDVVDAVLRLYERLPEEMRTRLPLQRVWMLA